jgi:hypothetical protein
MIYASVPIPEAPVPTIGRVMSARCEELLRLVEELSETEVTRGAR